MKITFPAFKKWKENRKNRIMVKLSKGEALQVSLFLERLRIESPEYSYKKEVRIMEDLIDSQIWGKEYVANRRTI